MSADKKSAEQLDELNEKICSDVNFLGKLEKLGLIKDQKQEPRYVKIKDSQGTWIRDNETGIEYSCSIGLHLINH